MPSCAAVLCVCLTVFAETVTRTIEVAEGFKPTLYRAGLAIGWAHPIAGSVGAKRFHPPYTGHYWPPALYNPPYSGPATFNNHMSEEEMLNCASSI